MIITELDIWFGLLCISLILIASLGFYILKMKNKRHIHYAFLGIILSLFIWSFGNFLLGLSNFTNMFFVYFYFLGVCFLPVSLVFVGLAFAYTEISFNWKNKLIFLFPIIDYPIILTNKYHHLFFVKYSPINTLTEYGKFYYIHTIILYLYLFVGLTYLLYYSIKNSGFFSRQSLLIILGTSIPFVFNIFENFHIMTLPIYITPVAFSFTIICLAFAIFKFDFLNIVPIALQNVVDQISDSYVIINEDLEAIDYNKTFIDTFSNIFTVKRKESITKILNPEGNTNNIDAEKLTRYILGAIKEKKPLAFEKQIIAKEFDKYFAVEITPIIKNNSHIGTIILLKDITEHKKDMELIKQTQSQLLERERLASLGELAGGVAHDINSPLSVIMGGMTFIERLFIKYRDSFDNENMTPEKRKEIENEILHQISNSSNASQKIVKIVNSIRNHTRNLSGENIQDFYVSTVFEDIRTLLNHQIKSSGCELEVSAGDNTIVKGDPGKLGQVITNLVVNAIQAYDANPGKIELKSHKEEKRIIITVEDNAGGIPEMYREGIFSKMLTTKGTQGTGLGLYLSYSIVTGHFNGKMWFETEEGKGTKFYISIPIIKTQVEKIKAG
ncbi:MAG: histidine kinase N-terminal 7TM domain-containing protein [Ignavibacteriales bacterium]